MLWENSSVAGVAVAVVAVVARSFLDEFSDRLHICDILDEKLTFWGIYYFQGSFSSDLIGGPAHVVKSFSRGNTYLRTFLRTRGGSSNFLMKVTYRDAFVT